MADMVCDETGAEKRLFSACHNVTRAQFERGRDLPGTDVGER